MMASRSSTKEKKNSKKRKYEPLSDSEDDSDSASGSSADTTKKAKTTSVSATSTTTSSKSRHHKKLKRKLKKRVKHQKRNRKSQRRKKRKRYEDSSTTSSSCSAAESDADWSCDSKEAKECKITGLVKVEGSKCQTPVLFSILDSWEEFHKQILTDVLCNKYSSFSLSYLCKGADVLLTKRTWKIFIHFIQTQCTDKTVFINVNGSSSLKDKLSYKFLSPSSSSSSKSLVSIDSASSNPASSSKELSKEGNIIQQLDEENWSEKFISSLSRTDRESVIRKLIVNLLKPDTKCDKCSHKHKQCLVDHSKEIDSSLEKKMRSLLTQTEMRNFFDKRNSFQYVFGNASLLLNPLYTQCPLCGSIISLGHFNEILIKKDKLINHIEVVHQSPINSPFKGW